MEMTPTWYWIGREIGLGWVWQREFACGVLWHGMVTYGWLWMGYVGAGDGRIDMALWDGNSTDKIPWLASE